ncbi:MAG: EamA family transporter [Oscillospiraceae bacterium]|nr:EamA family transporter [Oscillospiraceae bacterium]
MFSYIWPIALVILSEVIYQICAKSAPETADPLAALTITYLVAALTSGILFFSLNRGANLLNEYSRLNAMPFLLGVSIVGLETGWIYAYRAGWQVSTSFIVQSAFLAVALLAVGYLLYHETLSWHKIVGIGICLIGLIFINHK